MSTFKSWQHFIWFRIFIKCSFSSEQQSTCLTFSVFSSKSSVALANFISGFGICFTGEGLWNERYNTIDRNSFCTCSTYFQLIPNNLFNIHLISENELSYDMSLFSDHHFLHLIDCYWYHTMVGGWVVAQGIWGWLVEY